MQLRTLPTLLCFLFSLVANSQDTALVDKPILLEDGEILYNKIRTAANNQMDSLVKIRYSGFIFLGFRTGKGDTIISARTTRNSPPILSKVVIEAILGQRFKVPDLDCKDISFVLPIRFNFLQNSDNLRDHMGLIELNLKDSSNFLYRSEFNDFFDFNSDQKSMFGTLTIFLPWIYIRQPKFH